MHELWHITVLVVTLIGGAGIALVALAPLVFDSTPPGLRRARPVVLAAAAVAGVLLVIEWTVVH